MEERHYLSDPRPIPDLDLPTWEVDIMREGVSTPIMTMTVDSTVLPPRKRKKKIVWKLPDNLDVLPKFGTEDKKRLLELFKQRKKELKRQRKSQTINQPNGDETPAPNSDGENQNQLNNKSSSSMSNGKKESLTKDHTNGHNNSRIASAPPPPGFGMSKLSVDDKAENSELPPKSQSPQTDTTKNRGKTSNQMQTNPTSSPNPEPLPSPPGLPQSPQMVTSSSSQQGRLYQPQETSTSKPVGNNNIQSSPPPPPGMPFPQQQPPGLSTNNNDNNRQFFVPENSTLAQVVTESYYLLLGRGMVQELCQYYTPTAQKSLTVGGAHALCTHVEQRQQQLQSLIGLVVNIKGVLQQPTVHGATLVLITGTCVQPHTLPFCHSLVLVPVVSGGFQIQNDALCLLTSEG